MLDIVICGVLFYLCYYSGGGRKACRKRLPTPQKTRATRCAHLRNDEPCKQRLALALFTINSHPFYWVRNTDTSATHCALPRAVK